MQATYRTPEPLQSREGTIGCVALYANPPHAFTDIYALLKFICVFAYIYCVYSPLYAKKNPSDKRVEIRKKNQQGYR